MPRLRLRCGDFLAHWRLNTTLRWGDMKSTFPKNDRVKSLGPDQLFSIWYGKSPPKSKIFFFDFGGDFPYQIEKSWSGPSDFTGSFFGKVDFISPQRKVVLRRQWARKSPHRKRRRGIQKSRSKNDVAPR